MIPVSEPLFSGNEKKYLQECIDTGWVSSEGPFVEKFETAYANFIGVKYGVAVSNGTAALEVALHSIGVTKDDEVILPSFTIISCAIACIRLGAKPVLVDIEPNQWNIDVNLIESKITKKTKALLIVHIYGHPVDMDAILDLKQKYGIKIIEDIAEAHGSKYFSRRQKKWLTCGAIGDASSVSFYGNKLITTGEGGMVLSNDESVAIRACSYRNLCFDKNQRFLHTGIGFNFRLTNLQAAVGLAQVEKIEEHIDIKQRNFSFYAEQLKEIPWLRFMYKEEWAQPIYWMYCVEIVEKSLFTAKEVIAFLSKNAIGSRPFFLGLHQQKVLEPYIDKGSYPVTDRAFQRGFYLPSGLTLNKEKVDLVIQILKSFSC